MANKVSRARLIFQDGAAASSDFPLSNSDLFIPGNKIEILAGAVGQEQTIFNWIVTQARRLGRFVAQAGVPQDPNERLRLAGRAAVAIARRMRGKITQPLLSAALTAVRIRYGLTSIEPFEQGGTWWIRTTINPDPVVDSGVPVDANNAQAETEKRDWPVSSGTQIRVPSSPFYTVAVVGMPEHKGKPDAIVDTSKLIHSKHKRNSDGTKGDDGTQTLQYRYFMDNWDSGSIRLASGNPADKEREALTASFGAEVAAQIMRRSNIRRNLNVFLKDNGEVEIGNKEEAHHIIPISVLKKSGALQLLVRNENWDHNAAINAVGLDHDFHGYHNHYNAYVLRLIRNAELWFSSPNFSQR